MENIDFFFEDIEPINIEIPLLQSWIAKVITNHQHQLEQLNFILCSDGYLLDINKKYLSHDYYTDVITFNNADDKAVIEGDIYISIDRVKDNAKQLELSFKNELNRVIIHGALHLLGFNDKTNADQTIMTRKEDECLALIGNINTQ